MIVMAYYVNKSPAIALVREQESRDGPPDMAQFFLFTQVERM